MGVDRTNEFLAAVKNLQRPEDVLMKPMPAPVVESVATQFTKGAGLISRGIHDTTLKLERLTKLAKRQSLYEDNSSQVRELTAVVRSDLRVLQSELDNLSAFNEGEGRGLSKQSKDSNHAIITNLKAQLATATKALADVLQTRSATEKEQNSRRKTFEDTSARSLPKHRANRFVADVESGSEELQQLAPQEDQYLSSRAQAVENIEGMIHELGQMYAKLTNIIELQGEMAIRIDENMDTTLDNVDRGYKELQVHLSRISGNQWLIIKVFAVLITFSTFFVVFVA